MKNYQLLSITRRSPIKGASYNVIEFEVNGELYEYTVYGEVITVEDANLLVDVLSKCHPDNLEKYRVQPEEEQEEPSYTELLEMLHQNKLTINL